METPARQGLDEPVLPRQRTARTTFTAYPLCPTCRRPVTLHADVIQLADGCRALDAGGLRLALRIHLRRCEGT